MKKKIEFHWKNWENYLLWDCIENIWWDYIFESFHSKWKDFIIIPKEGKIFALFWALVRKVHHFDELKERLSNSITCIQFFSIFSLLSLTEKKAKIKSKKTRESNEFVNERDLPFPIFSKAFSAYAACRKKELHFEDFCR